MTETCLQITMPTPQMVIGTIAGERRRIWDHRAGAILTPTIFCAHQVQR
ncbi:MAG: hypothetical protein QGI08_00090 [Paracoccaceae bacterium]|nr:hypothetical protein [Paracoccaceae bacterium]MDP7184101.1 hypothetical protein [Paracoccaceae bacterium]